MPTGADEILRGLCAAGVEVCFANPGTSEMHLVAALEASPLRAVLVLFEGVASGAADGYGRITGKPASALFHLGPGFANAIANLHNARRAATPIVVLIGDHPDSHLPFDAPLTSDIPSLARPVSGWLARLPSAQDGAAMAMRAAAEARKPPGQIASLVIPADCAWSEIPEEAPSAPLAGFRPARRALPDDAAVSRSLAAVKKARKPALLLRGHALTPPALAEAAKIAAVCGARILCDTFPPHLPRGAGCVSVERLPYFPEQVEEALAGTDCLILAGAKPPVSFFAYQGRGGSLVPAGCETVVLARGEEDNVAALQMLASALGAGKQIAYAEKENHQLPPDGALTPLAAGQALAALMPEGAVLCDESATSGGAAFALTATAAPHDYLPLTGGAIGQALPLATGAALGAPSRKTICLSGDGGAMYTLQSLWTQKRENLDVLTVIFSNRSYAILRMELARAGVANPGPKALSLFDLANPDIGWPQLAEALGVEASRAETAEDFSRQLASGLTHKGPRLIEAVI